MNQGKPLKTIDCRSRTHALAGKPTLEGMPLEIQIEILRHLLRRNCPIKLCPFDSESDQSWDFGSLGILRTSKHLSNLALDILYGENSFKLLKTAYLVTADSEFESDSLDPNSCGKELEHPHWGTLKDLPRDIRSYVSSLDCLDLISQTIPGQERLRSVSVEMGYDMIVLFLEGLIPQILKRLRALESLELIVEHKAWTWVSLSSCTTEKGRPSHVFDRDLLLLIKGQLGHIKEITTTNYIEADIADEGPCPWIVKQLERRNRTWTPQLAGENRFVRTRCAMVTLDPLVLERISDIEYAWRKIPGSSRAIIRVINPSSINTSSDEPRVVFH